MTQGEYQTREIRSRGDIEEDENRRKGNKIGKIKRPENVDKLRY